MDYKNTPNHFGIIAILFHWGMAIFLIGMLALGLYMTNLPIGLKKLKLIGWHKELGLLALFLVSLRISWRFVNVVPLYIGLSSYEIIGAKLSHVCLYLLMFALPMTGWLMSSANGLSISFFGLFLMPNLISPNPAILGLLRDLHGWLAYLLIGIVVLHMTAALKHHFINKDDILRRML